MSMGAGFKLSHYLFTTAQSALSGLAPERAVFLIDSASDKLGPTRTAE